MINSKHSMMEELEVSHSWNSNCWSLSMKIFDPELGKSNSTKNLSCVNQVIHDDLL